MTSTDDPVVKALIEELQRDRDKYLGTLTKLNDTLVRALASNPGTSGTSSSSLTASSAFPANSPSSPVLSAITPFRRATAPQLNLQQDIESVKKGSIFSGGTLDDDDDEELSDNDESFFAQDALPPESFIERDLCIHLAEHDWDEQGRRVLGPIIEDKTFLNRTDLFKDEHSTEKDHENYTHGSVYDIGPDGSALLARPDTEDNKRAIWQSLSSTNKDPNKRQAVGRIAVVREPSPLLFGAIHYAMDNHFDMDFILKILADDSITKAYMRGGFEKLSKQQRSFVFCLKNHTIVGDDRKPMDWQFADDDISSTVTHIPISACSSVVALSLSGPPMTQVRMKSRRAPNRVGQVFDPFAPWRVLNIQCYPDWKSTVDGHESNRHYVNGPEAFIVTLLIEYRDAQKRFMEINKRIVALATPPASFMFDKNLRDDLLFEDKSYTYSRRYFWAFQTLATMNDKIEDMINAYRDTFTDDVWTGKHKLLWPGDENASSRFSNFRKKMGVLRKEFEHEIKQLQKVLELNQKEQKDIKSLRDQLFNGTSVLESRKSVEQAEIAVMQGQNIKLLTLVSIFFLPLTFVTSIFGMTNMPQHDNYVPFAIVTVCICMPTYLMIGSLNTHRGMRWWRNRTADIYQQFLKLCIIWYNRTGNYSRAMFYYHKSQRREDSILSTEGPSGRLPRSETTINGMAARARPSHLAASSEQPEQPRPALHRPHTNSAIKFDNAAMAVNTDRPPLLTADRPSRRSKTVSISSADIELGPAATHIRPDIMASDPTSSDPGPLSKSATSANLTSRNQPPPGHPQRASTIHMENRKKGHWINPFEKTRRSDSGPPV